MTHDIKKMECGSLVTEGKGNLFRRKDGKYLLYIPVDLAEDSMFPFDLREQNSVKVKVSFIIGEEKLVVEKLRESENIG